MPYINFTTEQIYRANSVDLEQFLVRQGEKLIPSGREKRLASDHSVTIHGNSWYDHSSNKGGLAIDFIKNHYGLPFPEAVLRLLGGETGMVYEKAEKEQPGTQKTFALPPAHTDMRRVFAYLLQSRMLNRDIVSYFAKEKLIYESCERIKGKQGEWKECHNAIFVGLDENGIARHAHKRGLYTDGGYKGNADGSDRAYSFHYIGTGSHLFAFEAPVDMLSYISLHPEGWQTHSYVALCGVAEHAMLRTLELYPHLREIVLSLDHDVAGIEATRRLTGILAEKGYAQVEQQWPIHKDWNEDIKAGYGLTAIPAEEHPQLAMFNPTCNRIVKMLESTPKSVNPEKQLPDLLNKLKGHLHYGRFEKAIACLEDMAALALFMVAREYRQMGMSLTNGDLSGMLCKSYAPYQNRRDFQNHTADLAHKLQTALSIQQMNGIRSLEQKQKQADVWMDLTVGCVKAIISVQANEIKQDQAQGQRLPAMTMV